jgi:hypothetical protein
VDTVEASKLTNGKISSCQFSLANSHHILNSLLKFPVPFPEIPNTLLKEKEKHQ